MKKEGRRRGEGKRGRRGGSKNEKEDPTEQVTLSNYASHRQKIIQYNVTAQYNIQLHKHLRT
jgi:hypothetical protein